MRGNYVAAVKPGEGAQVVYRLANSRDFKAPYVTSAVADGDHLFLIYDRGFASCIDAPTGEIQWMERIDAAFSGSPVRANDKIFCMDEDGVVWVIAADPSQLHVLAQNPLGRGKPLHTGNRGRTDVSAHLLPSALHRQRPAHTRQLAG